MFTKEEYIDSWFVAIEAWIEQDKHQKRLELERKEWEADVGMAVKLNKLFGGGK